MIQMRWLQKTMEITECGLDIKNRPYETVKKVNVGDPVLQMRRLITNPRPHPQYDGLVEANILWTDWEDIPIEEE